MAISMVRKPSETPNITNIDDIIPFRYAYGNQSGYVISRGAEVSHTVNGNQFTVNSGRLVIQGVESDIDSNGITLTIDSVSETRYYAVYHEINLATNTSNIKVEFDTSTYPNITEGDDLTANSSGISRLVLYNFIAQSGVISGVSKVVKAIDYTGTALVGYDNSKGTVEERLTKLGFKEGSIALESGVTASVNKVTRQGNYVLGELVLTDIDNSAWISVGLGYNVYNTKVKTIGRIPEQFRPKKVEDFGCRCTFETGTMYAGVPAIGKVIARIFSEGGLIKIMIDAKCDDRDGGNLRVYHSTTDPITIKFGYEAKQL